MELNVLDVANGVFTPIAIYSPKSFAWEECYDKVGSSQVVFARTADVVDKIKVGRFLFFAETTTLHYIHTVEINTSEVWAYGYEAKALLQKKIRPVAATNAGDVTLSTQLRQAVSDYGNYSWLDRAAITGSMGTGNLDGLSYNSVYDYVASICDLADYGFRVYLEKSTMKGVLLAYPRNDVSATIRLSTNLGNINEYTYTKTNKGFATKVYAVGSDDTVVSVERSQTSSPEVYEAILDLRDTFPKPDNMSASGYISAMTSRARMSLGQRKNRQDISIPAIDKAELGGDAFRLGQIVTVAIPEIGVNTTKSCDTITYTAEDGVLSAKVTLV